MRLRYLPLLFLPFLAHSADIPTVPTLAALKALPSTQTSFINRQGFTSIGDGGAAFYRSSSSPCSLNTGLGDDGSQVRAANGGCWLLIPPTGPTNIRVFGAVCDGTTNDAAKFSAIDAAAIDQIGVFNSCAIGSTLSLNHPVWISNTGSIPIASTFTVNFNGGVNVQAATPFPGAGTAALGSNQTGVQMFGAPGMVINPPAGGNALTLSRLNSSAFTSPTPMRQYVNNFGMVSNTGGAYIGSPVAAAGNAAFNVGAECTTGSGDCWASIFPFEMDPTSGAYSAFGQEIDVFNNNVPVGMTAGAVGALYRPYAYGSIYEGVGVNAGTGAIAIFGVNGAWNHGISAPADNIIQDLILDNTSALYGYKATGSHDYGIDLSTMPFGSTRATITNPGICTAVPTVAFSGGGGSGAAATPYLGVLDSSTILTAGTGYKVGDTVRFDNFNVPSFSARNVFAVGEVLTVNGSGGVTAFTFAYKDPLAPTTLNATAALGATSISLASTAGVISGDIISIALDVGGDIQQVFATSNPSGSTISISAPLRHQASSGAQVIDMGRRTSRGALTAANAGLGQNSTSGVGTGWTLGAVYGLNLLNMTNYGGNYSASPTVTVDAAHTACAALQPTATASAGGVPFRMANLASLVSRNAAGTADLSLIHASGDNGTQIGNAGNYNNFQNLYLAAPYTVATLPAALNGAHAYVTDAVACGTFMGALTGGGSTGCPVFGYGGVWKQGG
jgi:hypothetical protein